MAVVITLYKSDYTLGGGQNSLSVPPQASYTLWWSSKRAHSTSTCVAVVKMDSPKFYKAQGWSKKTLRTSSFLHAWRVSKRTMRTSAILLHAWWRFNLTLPTATSLLHAWRYSKRTLQTPTCLAAVKTDSPNFYKPPTRLAVAKTDYPNFPNITTDSVLLTNTLESGLKKKIRTRRMSTSLLHT